MKKILLIICAVVAFSCGDNKSQSDMSSEEANAEENVDENSGRNISPQLVDSTDRFEVDTISSSQDAHRENEKALDGN